MDNNRNNSNTEKNGQTRRVPVQTNNSETRQIPVQKQGSRAVPRPTPVQSVNTDPSETRQIPISTANTANTPSAKPRPSGTNAQSEALTRTKQIKIPSVPANGADGTKVIPTPVNDGLDAAKKKTHTLHMDKPDANGSNALVSIIKAVVYIVAVLVISISASVFIILVGNDVYAFVKSDEVIDITIPENADIDDIASILSNNNIIKYPSIFKMYASHNKDDGKFIAGNYSVACNLDYEDLLASFKKQIDTGTSWVTIPEGYTTDEIIELMVDMGIGTKEGYVDAINNYPFDYWFVKELDSLDWKSTGRFYRLDGYLFPDTYEFYNESSERAVIEKLLARFNVIFGKKYREAAESMGMTTDQIVTIASMIEKEAGQASDFHLVSSVFHNRLQSQYFPKLQSDATVLYAIHHDTGSRPTTVTPEDNSSYDSPYNTYLYDGLPPGPIANPSASAINAALTPESTNYYYFVSYGVTTYFSETKNQHDQYIAMIKELIRQSAQ